MKPAIALLMSFLAVAAPASAADTVIHTFEGRTALGAFDAYGDRAVWTELTDDGETTGQLHALENGADVALGGREVGGVDATSGPDGKPTAVYERCGLLRCTYYRYDFASHRERVLKGTPSEHVQNWAYWRDRFALVQNGRLQVMRLGGKPRDIGRAKSLASKEIDYNGAAVSYINEYSEDEDVEVYEVAYWPTAGKGRIVLRAAHGASGDLSLEGARVSGNYAYATQRPGAFGGGARLWRVNLRTGRREYAGLPYGAMIAVPVGAKRALVHVCPAQADEESELDELEEDTDEVVDKRCKLILRDVTYRRP